MSEVKERNKQDKTKDVVKEEKKNENKTLNTEENKNQKTKKKLNNNKINSEEKQVNNKQRNMKNKTNNQNENKKETNGEQQAKTEEQNIDEGIEEVIDMQEEKNVDGNKKDGLHKYTIAISIISIILFVGLIIFSTIFALVNRNSDKIISGVSIKGVDVSKLTSDEAKEKIKEKYGEELNNGVKLQHNEQEYVLTLEQIEGEFSIDDAVNMAYEIGRSGKILKDNYTIINTNIHKIDITPSFTYSDELLTEFIENTSQNLPDTVKDSVYSVDGTKLIIDKGKKGYVIKIEELKNDIVEHIVNIENDTINIPVEQKEPEKIDLQKIHNEIYKEAKDAYYVKNPFTVYPHEDGLDFSVSMEEATNLLNSEAEVVTIPLKILKPKVTTNQIGTEAFPDLLASYSTTFATSNTNRATNIRLASNKINGVVLLPGQQFSYNAVVGKRTTQAGFKSAGVYMNGKVETGIGGGICQVSSTLYNTALRANLEIIKRSNHHFDTGYVPLSTDATVSWGGPEFIFKNSRNYPIKIVSAVNGGKITISMYGCKEDVEYEVIIKSETLQKIPMQTEYRTNTSLTPGTQKVVQKGHGGYKSRAYRILKLNGNVISTQLLSTDTYAQLPTIIEKN